MTTPRRPHMIAIGVEEGRYLLCSVYVPWTRIAIIICESGISVVLRMIVLDSLAKGIYEGC